MHPDSCRPRVHPLVPRQYSIALLFLATIVAPIHAQTTNYNAQQRAEMARRVPVTIVLSDALPSGASGAVIVRRRQLEPHDLILLDRNADPNRLSAALFALMSTREIMGDTARTDGSIRVSSTRGPAAWEKRQMPRIARMLRQLQKATPRAIQGVGVVRAYDVYLLPHALSGRMTASGKSGTHSRN